MSLETTAEYLITSPPGPRLKNDANSSNVIVGGFSTFSTDFRRQIIQYWDGENMPSGSGWTHNWSASNTFNARTVVDYSTNNARGCYPLSLGTSSSSYSLICQYVQNNAGGNSLGRLGAGRTIFDARFSLVTLSDGTNTYTFYAGLTNTSSSSAPTNGVFFRYTHSVNGGRWQAVSMDTSVETGSAKDTGVTPVAGTMQLFRIDVNEAASEARYFINGVLVATNTTNIPNGGTKVVGGTVGFIRSAGTSQVSCADIDLTRTEWNFSTPRF